MSVTDDRIDFMPEAVDPDAVPWRVVETDAINSNVDLGEKIASIPRARTRANEQIRLHEMAHVAYSEKHVHDTEMATIICRMCEEVRVDALLYKERHIDVRNRHDDFEWSPSTIPNKPFERAMQWLQTYFHSTHTGVAPDVKDFNIEMFKHLPGALQSMLQLAVKDIVHEPTNRDLMESHVRKLLGYFMPSPPPAPQTPNTKKESVLEEESKQVREERAQEKKEERAKQQKEKDKKRRPAVTQEQMNERYKESEELGESPESGVHMFGMAEVHDHIAVMPKIDNVKAPFTRTGRGLTPEFMEHYLVDKRIFRTEHRGGVIVLDCSGSMNPDFSKISRQMLDFPNLVVLSYQSVNHIRGVKYSQDDEGNDKYKQHINGRICVHARGGKIDPVFIDEPGTGGGNAVDIEAMEYGGKFRGPRVWVSDGKAHSGQYDTGEGGNYSKYEGAMARKVRATMHQHRYIRVTNLDDALAWITRSRPVVYYLTGVFDGANPFVPTEKDTRRGRRQ